MGFKAFSLLLLLASEIYSWTYQAQAQWTGMCGNTANQSPIDIPCDLYLNMCPVAKTYQVYWKDPMMQFGGSHHEDLKTYNTNNSWIRLSNQTNDYVFKMAQFHVHKPSQHTVNGQSYPMEIHFVHVIDNPSVTQYLVIGIFLQVDNTLNYDVFDSVKIESDTAFTHLFPFALTNKAAYHYKGSLTTPPCTQAVNWFVQTQPLMVKQSTIDRLSLKVATDTTNNRLIQRLGDRKVYLLGQGC